MGDRIRMKPLTVLAAGALAWLCVACTSSRTSIATLYPTGGVVTSKGVDGQLIRSCDRGDCRVQNVTFKMTDGRVYEGTLTIVSPPLPRGIVFKNVKDASQREAAAAKVPRGIMKLTNSNSSGGKLDCELTFTRGTANGFGTSPQVHRKARWWSFFGSARGFPPVQD